MAVLALVFGTTLIYFVLGYTSGPIWLALIVAYYTATACGHRLAAVIAAVAGLAIFPWLDYLLRDGSPPSLAGLAALAAWLLVMLGAGEAVRIRRERTAAAARIEEEETRRQASEERLRMARELHDSLGHYLSLISVQSGVALSLNQQLPEQARTSLATVKQASKEALTELRSVLDILRQDGERAPRSPTATLARLSDLVSQAAAPGLEVRAETERAFQLSFMSMLGNIRLLVASISTVVVFTLILVTASTMSMAIPERFRELAVLKARAPGSQTYLMQFAAHDEKPVPEPG